MLYWHLHCNSKCYCSSSEAYWQKQPPEVFYKKGIVTNFSKFTRKHLCQEEACVLKRHYCRFFPVNFPKFVGTLFLQNTFGQLLLYLEPCQISVIEVFHRNSKSLTVFAKKKTSYMFEGSNHALLAVSFSCIVNKITWRYSSSYSQMFLKTGVLKNFANFTGKQLRYNFYLIKLKALSPATLLKRLQHRCFPVNFLKFLRTPFSTVHLGSCFLT